ncbi:hypothetical protein LOS78_17795 [Paracoccus sp. MA]|uniref:hypothetical protein n=1 Tax=unclassified Paracoccus (in: a-proteobacteria) TaxID=2688777 RepID=UPI001E48AE74|nr:MULTISPECIES: hypothetical protein [unclassified Paracoccus (in: a-proteobacteria)]MDK8872020.1 hypothetical protein [Paracoccus sp. SSJ]UFM65484.1 hypothetical protein LOS78_17795 [Paracoccus sp. MA]
MKLYVATFWTGHAWADLHDDPRPFRAASVAADSALLAGKRTTRLRPVEVKAAPEGAALVRDRKA